MSGISIHTGSDFQLVAVHGMLHTGGNIKFAGGEGSTNQAGGASSAILQQQQQQQQQLPAKLLSIVGNGISSINLQRNSTQTHMCCNSNVTCFDVAPDGDLIFAVGSNGLAVFYSVSAGLALDTVSLPPQCSVQACVFSPDGRFVALGIDATLQIYAAPAERTVSFHGCHRVENVHNAVNDSITHIEWTSDSQCVLLCGADARVRVYPRDARNRIGWAAAVNNLIGHRAPVVAGFWADRPSSTIGGGGASNDNGDKNDDDANNEDPTTTRCITVSNDNVVIEWHRSTLRRKEVMDMIWQLRRRAQLTKQDEEKKNKKAQEKQKKKKKKEENNNNNDDDDADAAESDKEDDDDDSDDEEDEIVPQSFLERQKQQARAAEGAPEDAVRSHITKGSDEHLHPAIRFGFETHKRHLLQHKGVVTSAAYHRRRSLLALGYSTGLFAVHAVLLDDSSLIEDVASATAAATATSATSTTTSTALPLLHVLSATAQALSSAAFSAKGDLIAFGSAHLKQLLVWDWRQESAVLKEQSHYMDITCSALTSDGALIVSGGDDGKAKVWRRSSGQCVASFAEHMGGITGIATSPATNAFFTASKDGTCRGFDLVRYRNFRVFSPSDAGQLSCIAVDASGELIAAGSATSAGTITIWSVQTGKIVEEFDGHESGPITCLSFHSSGATLYSGAVDKQLLVWDLFNSGQMNAEAGAGQALRLQAEAQQMPSEVLCTSAALNGSRLAVLLLNGEMQVFDTMVPTELELVIAFPTSFEAAGGWQGRVGPKSANSNAHFNSAALTPDGKRVLCGGESRWIAMFHAEHGYLMHKWPVTTNGDLLGVSEQFDYRNAVGSGEAGFMANDVQTEDDDPHLRQRKLVEMPGSKHSHFATGKRKTALAVRTMHVCFAGHGRDFVAATTVGLLLFSADAIREKFAPLSLRRDLTTASVKKMLRGDDHADSDVEDTASAATEAASTVKKKGKLVVVVAAGKSRGGALVLQGLIGALILQDEALIQEGLRRVPPSSVSLVCDAVPTAAFPRLIRAVADAVAASDAIEHAFLWAKNLMLFTSEPLFGPLRSDEVALPLRQLYRAVAQYEALRATFCENDATLAYLSSVVNRRSRIMQ